ncbi:MAG: KilA-N domain-containing protein [Methylobacter sp.]
MNQLIKPKYEVFAVNNIEITVDVSLLLKSEELYFNATDIAKQFGKRPQHFLELASTHEYIEEILKESQGHNSGFEDLVRITQGGKYKGTWLHQELAYEFAGWLSATFRRNLHKWVDSRLREEHQRQQHRLELKTGFLPLTNAIQAAHPDLKPYHFSNECDMINRLVTGMSAKKFKQVRGIENVRDGLTAAEAQLMDKLQMQNTCLIELGFSYEDRKCRLQNQADKFLGAIGEVAA